MRQYSVDSKGVEHSIGLYIENWWAGDRESYVTPTPSAYNIDACEDTEVLSAHYRTGIDEPDESNSGNG